jgi:hypothetical protein
MQITSDTRWNKIVTIEHPADLAAGLLQFGRRIGQQR